MINRFLNFLSVQFSSKPEKIEAEKVVPDNDDREIQNVQRTVGKMLAAGDVNSAAELLGSERIKDLSGNEAVRSVQARLRISVIFEKQYNFELAYNILRDAVGLSPERILPRLAALAVKCNRIDDTAKLIDSHISEQSETALLYARGRLYLENGHLEQAKTYMLRAEAIGDPRLDKYLRRDLNNIKLAIEAAELLEQVPQPADPNGLAIICNTGPLIALWSTLPALQLRKDGYATVCVSRNSAIPITLPVDETMATIHGALSCDFTVLNTDGKQKAGLVHEWEVDWPNKSVKTGGINVYQGIFERLSTVLKKYSIDISSPEVRCMFDHQLLQCDRVLTLCETIFEQIVVRGISIRFFISGSHFAPFFTAKQFCASLSDEHSMECLTFYPSYEHYYNNLANTLASKVSVCNDTRYPERRSGIYAGRDQFESWLSHHPDPSKEAKKALSVLNFDRTDGANLSEDAKEVLAKIRRHRETGGAVLCLFGKIVYDMAIPYEGGPAHKDMADWLNHTIECARNTNTLLLIKPHPHEVKTEMHRPNEMFHDLVDVPLPPNVILLEHRWLNMRDLVSHLDAGILWHGTSALELGMAGVPVVMASHWGRLDFPIDFAFPTSREDYEGIIGDPTNRIIVPQGYSERCALLSRYLASEEIMIPFPYATVPVIAPKSGEAASLPGWRMDEVKKYQKNGDAHLDRIVSICR